MKQIETDEGGLLQMHLHSPSEYRRYGEGQPITALLTARGKDHHMTAEMLEQLERTCLKWAELMRTQY
jgi:hypothetical protein